MGKIMNYQIESIKDLKNEIQPLIEKHWEEIALNQDKVKLNPDWNTYYKIEDLGMLRCYTARVDSTLVGYFCVIVNKHLHYADTSMAMCDVLYIAPARRRGRAGIGLIKFAERNLSAGGTSVLYMNTKDHAPFDNLLIKLGFSLAERTYSKYIGE